MKRSILTLIIVLVTASPAFARPAPTEHEWNVVVQLRAPYVGWIPSHPIGTIMPDGIYPMWHAPQHHMN